MKRLLDAPHRVFFFAATVQILLASAAWSRRHLPYYWRPRPDGKPG